MQDYISKGLLWKEWQQNKGLLLLGFLVLSVMPFMVPYISFQWGNDSFNWLNIHDKLAFDAAASNISMGFAILLGAVLLGQERKETMLYLVSLPVSRRQIIISKFLYGALAIVLIMLVTAAFLIIVKNNHYSFTEVFNWFLLSTGAYMALFTLALMIASFINSTMTSFIATLIFMQLPYIFINIYNTIAFKYWAASQQYLISNYKLASYLTLSNYLTRANRHQTIDSIDYSSGPLLIGTASHSMANMGNIAPDYRLESILLIIITLVCFLAALKIFENNRIEDAGIFSISKLSQQVIFLAILLLIGLMVIVVQSATLSGFLVNTLIFILILVIGWFLWRGKKGGNI